MAKNGLQCGKRGFPVDTTSVVPGFSPARLRAARTRREMSRNGLAQAVGASEDAVRAWEDGTEPVKEYTLRLLCYAMGVAPAALLDPPEGDGGGV